MDGGNQRLAPDRAIEFGVGAAEIIYHPPIEPFFTIPCFLGLVEHLQHRIKAMFNGERFDCIKHMSSCWIKAILVGHKLPHPHQRDVVKLAARPFVNGSTTFEDYCDGTGHSGR